MWYRYFVMAPIPIMVITAACCLCGSVSHGQDISRAFGYVPVSQEEFSAFPKTSRYRSFLPEAVDLSSRFPTPGEQGRLNACTGWAVGYAC